MADHLLGGHPAPADDMVVPTLAIPVNHEVALLFRSQDVIHNSLCASDCEALLQDLFDGHNIL